MGADLRLHWAPLVGLCGVSSCGAVGTLHSKLVWRCTSIVLQSLLGWQCVLFGVFCVLRMTKQHCYMFWCCVVAAVRRAGTALEVMVCCSDV
jgi:hypothetical protein